MQTSEDSPLCPSACSEPSLPLCLLFICVYIFIYPAPPVLLSIPPSLLLFHYPILVLSFSPPLLSSPLRRSPHSHARSLPQAVASVWQEQGLAGFYKVCALELAYRCFVMCELAFTKRHH